MTRKHSVRRLLQHAFFVPGSVEQVRSVIPFANLMILFSLVGIPILWAARWMQVRLEARALVLTHQILGSPVDFSPNHAIATTSGLNHDLASHELGVVVLVFWLGIRGFLWIGSGDDGSDPHPQQAAVIFGWRVQTVQIVGTCIAAIGVLGLLLTIKDVIQLFIPSYLIVLAGLVLLIVTVLAEPESQHHIA